jgi:hypothetical protein
MVVEGEEEVLPDFFNLGNWTAWQQPAELWTNGCYSGIQEVRNVQKQSWKEF